MSRGQAGESAQVSGGCGYPLDSRKPVTGSEVLELREEVLGN